MAMSEVRWTGTGKERLNSEEVIICIDLLKLRKAKIGSRKNKQFDVSKLKDPGIREEFNITLRNHYSKLQDETAITIDQFHQFIKDAAAEVIGYKKYAKSEWLSKDTWTTIEERKQLKKKLLDAKSPILKERAAVLYRKKDREVKTSARKDRRHYTEQLAKDAQEAAERKDMKTVYQIRKKLRGDHGPNQDLPVKAEDGSAITEELAKLESWREHLENILNRPDSPILPDIDEAETDPEIETGCITVNERIIQDIWDKEDIPDDWKKGVIIKLPKKGDLGDCINWRGITLLYLTSKVFSQTILQRITAAVDDILRQEQAGFRKWKSCVDHIFSYDRYWNSRSKSL
ncbi:uncharacterized protein LOC134276298 [Saccostrea cucullata]|uniref:uncharacterized protein LOC134276298 n=1 Tax=Saccostrea cuccullata TaxID=36930 RepID=UPI002ED59250